MKNSIIDNIFICKKAVIVLLGNFGWKCYRCDLTFKEELHAKLHEEISKHAVTSVKVIEA